MSSADPGSSHGKGEHKFCQPVARISNYREEWGQSILIQTSFHSSEQQRWQRLIRVHVGEATEKRDSHILLTGQNHVSGEQFINSFRQPILRLKMRYICRRGSNGSSPCICLKSHCSAVDSWPQRLYVIVTWNPSSPSSWGPPLPPPLC